MKKKYLSLLLIGIIFLSGCISTTKYENDANTGTNYNDSNTTLSNQDDTMNQEPQENVTVLLKTSMGDIKVELFNSTMPITAGNFQKLVEEGFYNGVIFHRVIPGFMAQGGDPTGTGTGGPGYTIEDEFTSSNSNDRGTLSMANAGPNTGGSQFFINVVDNNFLDSKHPVFGRVVEGMDIVDEIVRVERDGRDKPLVDVVIKKAKVIDKD